MIPLDSEKTSQISDAGSKPFGQRRLGRTTDLNSKPAKPGCMALLSRRVWAVQGAGSPEMPMVPLPLAADPALQAWGR